LQQVPNGGKQGAKDDYQFSIKPKYQLFQLDKKQGAAGITTAAPYVAGQWGRGDNRLQG